MSPALAQQQLSLFPEVDILVETPLGLTRDRWIAEIVAENVQLRAKARADIVRDDAVECLGRKLFDMARANGGVCWPTDGWLEGRVPDTKHDRHPGRVSGATGRTMQRIFKGLVDRGHIRRHRGPAAIFTARLHGGELPDGRYRVIELKCFKFAQVARTKSEYDAILRARGKLKHPYKKQCVIRDTLVPSFTQRDILASPANRISPTGERVSGGVPFGGHPPSTGTTGPEPNPNGVRLPETTMVPGRIPEAALRSPRVHDAWTRYDMAQHTVEDVQILARATGMRETEIVGPGAVPLESTAAKLQRAAHEAKKKRSILVRKRATETPVLVEEEKDKGRLAARFEEAVRLAAQRLEAAKRPPPTSS